MNTTLTILSLVPDFLRALAGSVTSTSPVATAIDELLNAGAALIEQGDQAALELQTFTSQIQSMVAAGRDPTEEEWAALKARSDAAHASLQGGTAPPQGAAPPQGS